MSTKISQDRIDQISNNVSEEFADHGQTNFATKAELCQVIQWWQQHSDEGNNRFQQLRCDLTLLLAQNIFK